MNYLSALKASFQSSESTPNLPPQHPITLANPVDVNSEDWKVRLPSSTQIIELGRNILVNPRDVQTTITTGDIENLKHISENIIVKKKYASNYNIDCRIKSEFSIHKLKKQGKCSHCNKPQEVGWTVFKCNCCSSEKDHFECPMCYNNINSSFFDPFLTHINLNKVGKEQQQKVKEEEELRPIPRFEPGDLILCAFADQNSINEECLVQVLVYGINWHNKNRSWMIQIYAGGLNIERSWISEDDLQIVTEKASCPYTNNDGIWVRSKKNKQLLLCDILERKMDYGFKEYKIHVQYPEWYHLYREWIYCSEKKIIPGKVILHKIRNQNQLQHKNQEFVKICIESPEDAVLVSMDDYDEFERRRLGHGSVELTRKRNKHKKKIKKQRDYQNRGPLVGGEEYSSQYKSMSSQVEKLANGSQPSPQQNVHYLSKVDAAFPEVNPHFNADVKSFVPIPDQLRNSVKAKEFVPGNLNPQQFQIPQVPQQSQIPQVPPQFQIPQVLQQFQLPQPNPVQIPKYNNMAQMSRFYKKINVRPPAKKNFGNPRQQKQSKPLTPQEEIAQVQHKQQALIQNHFNQQWMHQMAANMSAQAPNGMQAVPGFGKPMPLPMQQVNYVPMAPVPMIHTSGLSNIGMVMQIPGPTPPSLSSMTRPKFVRMVTPGGSQVPLPTFQITNPNPVNQAPPDTSKYNIGAKEFVPGVQISDSQEENSTPKKKSFNVNATEFVPGSN